MEKYKYEKISKEKGYEIFDYDGNTVAITHSQSSAQEIVKALNLLETMKSVLK